MNSKRFKKIAGRQRHVNGWRRGGRHPPGMLTLEPSFMERFGPTRAVLKSVASLRVEDQSYLGVCTCEAATSAGEYVSRQLGGADAQFSVLALYAWARDRDGTPLSEDSGSLNTTVARVASQRGFPLDETWPYEVAKWDREPPPTVGLCAEAHRLLMHVACPSVASIEASIQQDKPVVIGFECFESLDSAEVTASGMVPFRPSEEVVGGHAVLVVGYDRSRKFFYFMNSWGTEWGTHLTETKTRGFGMLPYEFFLRGYADDAISYRTVAP